MVGRYSADKRDQYGCRSTEEVMVLRLRCINLTSHEVGTANLDTPLSLSSPSLYTYRDLAGNTL
jgi:hypothetical protein